MKKIAIIIAVTFGSFQLFASQIVIKGTTPKTFTVAFQNVKYNSYNGSVKITNVTPGNHEIKIIRQKFNHGQNTKIVTKTRIQVPARSTVFADVYPNNSLVINHVQNNAKPKTVYNNTPSNSHGSPHRANTTVYSTPKTYNSHYTATPRYYAPVATCNADFNRIYTRLNRMRFDSDRFIATKNVIQNNNFTSAQVYDLVQMFNFEDYKLKISKLAFNKTVDQYNYNIVYNALRFESSKIELDNYIAQFGATKRNYNNGTYYSYSAY